MTMEEVPNYITIPDSAMLVAIPVHEVEYVSDDGTAGKVSITAGIYRFGYDDNEKQTHEVIELPIIGSIEKAHCVICYILGLDRHKNSRRSPHGYKVTNVVTKYVYKCEADGSSA